MTRHHLHLVSDATGETVSSVVRACMVQFKGIEPVEHVWSLIRTKGQMNKVIAGIENEPGPVVFTLVDDELRQSLIEACRPLGVPCVPVIDPVIHALAATFGVEISGQPGLQHMLDAEYFSRIDAMNFALGHDDGQGTAHLEDAVIILVGVSRTSKTPTCMYLANRGIKAANVPVVPGCPLPGELLEARRPLIIGLTKDPARLVQVRRNRLRMISGSDDEVADYIDPDTVREEVAFARRIFAKNNWPVIDVTRRSIEETAASILTYYATHSAQA